MTQGIEEQIGIFPAIETEAHLFEIRREMLGANSVPRSHDSTLEKREGRFYGVGVNLSDYVNFLAVIDLPVSRRKFTHRTGISGKIIGNEYVHILADILADVSRQRTRLGVRRMKETQLATTLTDSFQCHA
jgi:hypothetical protein